MPALKPSTARYLTTASTTTSRRVLPTLSRSLTTAARPSATATPSLLNAHARGMATGSGTAPPTSKLQQGSSEFSPAEVTAKLEGVDVTFPTQLFINGEWVNGAGAPLTTINPATEEPLANIHTATNADVDAAVAAARDAFENTWGLNVSGPERGRLLYKFADALEANLSTLAALEAADSGKPLHWATNDINAGIACIRYYAGWADKISGYTIDVGEKARAVTVRKEPIGVVAQVIPWNYPFMLMAWKLGPSLATGCSVVMKPAENTPLSALLTAKIASEVGFPKGAFNLVNGLGKDSGQYLAEHMDVDKIAFTGSTAVGRLIAAASAKSNLKVVTLELGGKSPNVIFPSANLKEAAKWAALGLFENTGQCCVVGSRILVHEDVHDEFVKLYVEAAKKVDVGKTPQSFYGSLISKTQFDRVMNFIESGKSEAKLELGGGRAGDKGFFVQPTVFSNVKPEHRIAKEEIFGPVASIIKFKDEAEAIRMANDTEYGLAAGVHTQDASQLARVTQKIKAGTVWANHYMALLPSVPFGGYKASGWGRELGPAGLEPYLATKSVNQYYGDDLTWPLLPAPGNGH